MISQDFLTELEISLLRSYAKASSHILPRNQREPNFLGSAQYKEDFVNKFMAILDGRRLVLNEMIQYGGHKNSAELLDKVYKTVEDAIRAELVRNLLNQKTMDELSFRKVLRELKNTVRSVFYQGYLGK